MGFVEPRVGFSVGKGTVGFTLKIPLVWALWFPRDLRSGSRETGQGQLGSLYVYT